MVFLDLLAPVPYIHPEDSADAEKTVMPVEHSSSLGQFLRRCILSFNLLTFEVRLFEPSHSGAFANLR